LDKERAVDEIQLLDFQKNVYDIVKSVKNSHKPVMICDEGKSLVKIIPISYTEQESWLGSMRDRGKISGDIISPVEDATAWKALSE
jgi:antitoxin (DNA-binding transcriptional repressor) of toxin-antitoxin stability system